MKIDFSQPITAYELIAIILAALAIIIPALKWAYDKWIKKLSLTFLPSGTMTLFHNKSGSYLSLGGVYSAKNKSAIIKEINALVIRESDNANLEMTWSTFSSPVFKKVAGNYESSFETAHPFKVDSDSLEPVFVEYTNSKENLTEKTDLILKPVYDVAMMILSSPNIDIISADNQVKNTQEAKKALIALNDDFFWKPGKYKLEMITYFNDSQMRDMYEFDISNQESENLRRNIESMIVIPVADHFRMNMFFHSVRKEFAEK